MHGQVVRCVEDLGRGWYAYPMCADMAEEDKRADSNPDSSGVRLATEQQGLAERQRPAAQQKSGDQPRTVGERLALLDQVRQTEIRATGFRVASVVGHLIGTPLNVIVGRAALILSNPEAASVEQNARKIEDQVAKLTQRIRRLIEYLNPPISAVNAQQVGQILADACALYGPVAEHRGVGLVVADHGLSQVVLEDGPTALVLLTSLLSMAVRTAPAGSNVEVNVRPGTEPRFEVLMPKAAVPKGRIESMEPPDDADPIGAEHLRTLAVASALARRLGGHLEVAAVPDGGLLAQFSFQSVPA